MQSRGQFQAVLTGKVISRTQHFALHCTRGPASSDLGLNPVQNALFSEEGPWFGALTPKRAAKRAVTRNLIRRQIYNVCNELNSHQQTAAYLIRLSAGFDKAQFTSASSRLLKAAVRLELLQLFAKARLVFSSTMADTELLSGGNT